jgi:Fe/S biogenesis protein NfuA
MIQITPQAQAKVLEFMKAQPDSKYLRIQVQGRSATEYLTQFLLEEKPSPTDQVIQADQIDVVIAQEDVDKVKSATVEWIESVSGSGFRLDNPNKPENHLDSPVAQKVQQILDDEINPSIAAHGGHIELLDIQDARAFVKMSGGCQGCSSASATLKQGVEVRIKELVPEISELVDTTDHAGGTNPYYSG